MGILERVSAAVGAESFSRYFDRQARLSVGPAGLEVTVPNEFLASLIDRRFGDSLRAAAREHLVVGSAVGSVDESTCLRIRVDRGSFESAPAAKPGPSAAGRLQARAGEPGGVRRERISAAANPIRHRLDEFLVGTSNKLAFGAAERLAHGDETCRSLFIHSSCGMGKTHLLQGVAARFIERNPGAAVRYTTAESFTNDYIAAVRANRIEPFRRVYRRVDLLCLDDVHFFANKEATQNELLHTFDAIRMDGARVVLASDEHPKDIGKLSAHLSSRFIASGVVKIDPPDPELRARLVRKLAQKRGMALEEAAASLVAERSARGIGTLGGFGGSVRELDGLVIQIEAVAKLLPEFASRNGSIGVLLVKKALGLEEQHRTRARRPIAPERIAEEVCRVLGVEKSEFLGRGRHRRIVLARSMAAYLCRKMTTLSFPEIAKAFGRPNHSSIVTSCKRFASQLEEGKALHVEVSSNLADDARGGGLAEVAEHVEGRVGGGA